MKNMVSGRKSDRNRKNIVFGKIPQKMLVVEKKSVIENFSMVENFSVVVSKNFPRPTKYFSIDNFFDVEKKCRPIFLTIIFLCPKTSFRQLFFLTSFFAFCVRIWFARSTIWVWAHAGERAKMRSSNLCVAMGYELDDKEILGARSPNSQNR